MPCIKDLSPAAQRVIAADTKLHVMYQQALKCISQNTQRQLSSLSSSSLLQQQ